jgi:hypothetical protein
MEFIIPKKLQHGPNTIMGEVNKMLGQRPEKIIEKKQIVLKMHKSMQLLQLLVYH